LRGTPVRAMDSNVSQTEIEYADFDLDGFAHKEASEEIKGALADVMLKAMGLPSLRDADKWATRWHEHRLVNPSSQPVNQSEPRKTARNKTQTREQRDK
jgi:hypothetical protein